MKLIRLLKRRVIASKAFWRIRHYLQPQYLDSYINSNTDDIEDLMSNLNCNSFLDFGCATGSLLFSLKKQDPSRICYGIDINKAALNTCKERFKIFKINSYGFHTGLENKRINTFLETNQISKFDITIFDRVLYCFENNELMDTLTKIKKRTKYVLIDDFYCDGINLYEKKRLGGYIHRDWIQLLSSHGFKEVKSTDSLSGIVENAHPKTILFKSLI